MAQLENRKGLLLLLILNMAVKAHHLKILSVTSGIMYAFDYRYICA